MPSFRFVHGDIGAGVQIFEVAGIVGNRDADADPKGFTEIGELDGLFEFRLKTKRGLDRRLVRFDVVDHDSKFVSAEPHDHFVVSLLSEQAFRGETQHFVAGRVS